MKAVSLKFPGRFEDSFLYMGRLVTITENHSIRVYDLEYIVNQLEEDKDLLKIPTLLFFRNDWIKDGELNYKSRKHTEKIEFLKAIQKLESAQIYIDEKFTKPVEWDLRIEADILLDLNIYNGRAYIGTNQGLYHLDLDWEQEDIVQIGKAHKRLDAKCIHTTAKYGTVNASCGSEGWFSFFDDFQLTDNPTRNEKHISEQSLRTTWLEFNVVNYSTTISPKLFNSIRSAIPQEFSESENNLEQEKWIVTDFGEEEFDLNVLFNDLNSLDLNDLQFVYNSSQCLFLSTYSGDLYTLGLQRSGDTTPTVSFCKKYKGPKGLISSIHTIRVGNGGLIVETDEQILLFSRQKLTTIFINEVISVRTFPRSRHYQNIVSITTADEISLIAIFDEEGY